MQTKEKGNSISIILSKEEAIVLFDWLSRFNETESTFQDKAEERVLFDLESVLEKKIPDVFTDRYEEVLQQARENIRD